jgi:AAA domain
MGERSRLLDLALLEMAANGTVLDAGQAALVRDMCRSGARLQLAIAPAGAGKTTAMRALTLAWTEAGGQVLGLAPSAAAAALLAEQTGIRTDTLAKLAWSLDHGELPGWAAAVGQSTLVIIDEAGMADTLSLDTAVQFAIGRGASVRLVRDDQQLAAIGAGGVLRDIQQSKGALHCPSQPPVPSDLRQPDGSGGECAGRDIGGGAETVWVEDAWFGGPSDDDDGPGFHRPRPAQW